MVLKITGVKNDKNQHFYVETDMKSALHHLNIDVFSMSKIIVSYHCFIIVFFSFGINSYFFILKNTFNKIKVILLFCWSYKVFGKKLTRKWAGCIHLNLNKAWRSWSIATIFWTYKLILITLLSIESLKIHQLNMICHFAR